MKADMWQFACPYFQPLKTHVAAIRSSLEISTHWSCAFPLPQWDAVSWWIIPMAAITMDWAQWWTLSCWFLRVIIQTVFLALEPGAIISRLAEIIPLLWLDSGGWGLCESLDKCNLILAQYSRASFTWKSVVVARPISVDPKGRACVSQF